MATISDFLYMVEGTQTGIDGVLAGENGKIVAKALDSSGLTDDNDHVPTSGVVQSALDAAAELISYDNPTGINTVKFPSGFMIQWGRVTGIDFNNEVMVSGTITLPVPFTSSGYVRCAAAASSTSNNDYLFRVGVSALSGTSISELSWCLGSGSGNAITVTGRTFDWVAFGRWK